MFCSEIKHNQHHIWTFEISKKNGYIII